MILSHSMSVREISKNAAQQNGESQHTHTETKSQRPERRAERPLGGKREGSIGVGPFSLFMYTHTHRVQHTHTHSCERLKISLCRRARTDVNTVTKCTGQNTI